jgi:hypothetical protein
VVNSEFHTAKSIPGGLTMTTNKFLAIFVILLLALSACSSNTATETSEEPSVEVATLDPEEVASAVAATVSAELTRIAIENPSPTPPAEPSETLEPTEEPTLAASPTATSDPLALENHALFITDVTIPDGTEIVAGTSFTKTWRLQNIGQNTWTTDYSVVFVNGDRMEGQPINFSADVPPGGNVDVTIQMIAPDEAGTYTGFWMLSDADDAIFGIGQFADQAFLVTIEVIEPTPTPTSTATSAPTATPQP